jgi:hypothetical protein
MVETTGCPLDEIDRYKVPTDLSLSGCLTQIQSIEDPIEPAVLGLNENAAILRNTNDSLDFLEGVLATQPQVEIGFCRALTFGKLNETYFLRYW